MQTLGCRLNQYETNSIRDQLEAAGYTIVSFDAEADLTVINTCTVTNAADAKSRSAIRRFIRRNPSAVTVVVGCYSQVGYKAIAEITGVDYIIGNNDKLNLLDYLGEEKVERPIIIRDRINREDFSVNFIGEAPFNQRANLKIQDGCDFMCSFCIIPFSRGRARSRDFKNLIQEARALVGRGVREFVLTGVNLGEYCNSKQDITTVIDALNAIEGLDRIRISSIEPTTIPEELFTRMASPEHALLPYLHIPLQSGCPRTLKRMHRKYSPNEVLEFIDRSIQQVPNLCVGTDFMVGFPGETDKDFEKTMRLIEKVEFSISYSFCYSSRPGTPASNMLDQIDYKIKKERLYALQSLLKKQQKQYNERFIGQNLEILFEKIGKHKNQFVGRSVYNQSVFMNSQKNLLGSIIKANINNTTNFALSAIPSI